MADGDRSDLPAPLPRRYSEEEVARILKRATEIRRESGPAQAGDEGLSLAELEEIAAEAGIDVTHLRRAALELDTGAEPDDDDWWRGGSRRVVLESVVPGRVPEDRMTWVVQVIEEVLEERGNTSYLGQTLTWRTEMVQGKIRTTSVSLGPVEGGTRIRIDEDLKMVSQSMHGGITWGAGFGIGFGAGFPVAMALGTPLLAAVFTGGTIGIAFLTARTFYGRFVAKRRRVAARLLGRLADVIRAESHRALPEGDAESRP